MTMDHDITVHERLASLETSQAEHARRVESLLGDVVVRLDAQNGRVAANITRLDALQAATRRTDEWKSSRDARIDELQEWRLESDLADAREAGRQAGRSELRKGDIAKLALVVASIQGLAVLGAWATGVL